MKKFMLFIMAVVMAVVFSAFTPAETSLSNPWYHDGTTWRQLDEDPCETPGNVLCQIFVDGVGTVQLYETSDFSSPIKYTP